MLPSLLTEKPLMTPEVLDRKDPPKENVFRASSGYGLKLGSHEPRNAF